MAGIAVVSVVGVLQGDGVAGPAVHGGRMPRRAGRGKVVTGRGLVANEASSARLERKMTVQAVGIPRRVPSGPVRQRRRFLVAPDAPVGGVACRAPRAVDARRDAVRPEAPEFIVVVGRPRLVARDAGIRAMAHPAVVRGRRLGTLPGTGAMPFRPELRMIGRRRVPVDPGVTRPAIVFFRRLAGVARRAGTHPLDPVGPKAGVPVDPGMAGKAIHLPGRMDRVGEPDLGGLFRISAPAWLPVFPQEPRDLLLQRFCGILIEILMAGHAEGLGGHSRGGLFLGRFVAVGAGDPPTQMRLVVERTGRNGRPEVDPIPESAGGHHGC